MHYICIYTFKVLDTDTLDVILQNNGEMGDRFMDQIEPISAYVPYMVAAGNHESAYNFSHYRYRFNMPGGTEGLWYR